MKQLAGIIIVVLILMGIWAIFSSLTRNGEENYQVLAQEWVEEESLTYPYDGSDLIHRNVVETEEGTYEHSFTFDSSQAGYGDRADQMSAQVITPHEIVVTVQNGRVVRAVTDGVFDEMTGMMIPGNENEGEQISLYFYREADDTDVTGNVLCSPDAVVATQRTIEDYSVEKHIQTLLLGTTAQEEAEGFSSEFPLEGVSLESVSGPDSNGVLTITINDTTNATTGGSCRVGILSSQVVKTGLSIPGVESVVILPEELFQP